MTSGKRKRRTRAELEAASAAKDVENNARIGEYVSVPKAKELDKLSMIRNYQVSYKSGWLVAGKTYYIKDIEGGQLTADKLINSGWAKTGFSESRTSGVVTPSLGKKDNDDSKDVNLAKIRAEAKARQGL
jgi:hypothetical protein